MEAEGLSDDWIASWSIDEDGELLESSPTPPPAPDHHPSKVRHLKLWFGGRDYLAHPHPLREWFEESNGDDLTDFLDARQ